MIKHQVQYKERGKWESVHTTTTQARAIEIMSQMIKAGDKRQLRVVAV